MGAVIKPVTGVVDMASKTAEGIKNTTTYFEAKKYNQMRYFYKYSYLYLYIYIFIIYNFNFLSYYFQNFKSKKSEMFLWKRKIF